MERKTKNSILDTFEVNGTKVGDFFDALKEIQESRKTEKVFIGDLIYGRAERRDDEFDLVRFYTPGKHSGKRFVIEDFASEDLYHEFTRGDFLWLGGSNPWRIVREKAFKELLSALGISGPALERSSARRNAYIEELISDNRTKTISLIVHKNHEDGKEKVLSVRTGKYTPINLFELEDVYNVILDSDMGAVKSIGWHIDHDFATIDLIFPEATTEFKELCGLRNDINAGIRLQTSGTGYCCFTAKEIWQVGGVISEHNTVKRKHIGEWKPEVFLKDVKENIFDEYTTLPEKLCELFNVIIIDDSTAKKSEAILHKVFKALIKYLNLNPVFKTKDEEGRKNYPKELCEELTNRFCNQVKVAKEKGLPCEITAYDIAIAVMELPATTALDIPSTYVEAFSNACGRAVYFPFKEGTEYLASKKTISIA